MMYSHETTMSSSEVNFLTEKLSKSRSFLEFGSGFSTVLASNLSPKIIQSVETDKNYLNYLIPFLNYDQKNITLIHANIGETTEWGNPRDTDGLRNWHKYSTSFDEDSIPDLVLIDGRFRVTTFATICLAFPGVNILFDDYADRPHYQEVEKILSPRQICGRIACFKAPRRTTRYQKIQFLKLQAQYALDYQ